MGWNHATAEFNMMWENDYDVHHAVLDYARSLLRQIPNMPDQTLGRYVKDRVYAWAYGGGWGWGDGWLGSTQSLRDCDRYPNWANLSGPPNGYHPNPFSSFPDRDTYGDVSEQAVADEVWDLLGITA